MGLFYNNLYFFRINVMGEKMGCCVKMGHPTGYFHPIHTQYIPNTYPIHTQYIPIDNTLIIRLIHTH